MQLSRTVPFLVESMQRTMGGGNGTNAPLAELVTFDGRPLLAVVVWGNPNVSERDHELVQELGIHFAAAFFEQVG